MGRRIPRVATSVLIHSCAFAMLLFQTELTFGGSLTHNVFRIDGITSDNVIIEADFQVNDTSFGDFEIWFNALWDETNLQTVDSGYRVFVAPANSDGPTAQLRRDDSDGGQAILDSTPNIIGDEEHTLQVRRFGNQIEVFLDGSPFLSALDSMHSGGAIGVRIFSDGLVDNVEVRDINGQSLFSEDFEDGVASGVTTTTGNFVIMEPGLSGSAKAYYSFAADAIPEPSTLVLALLAVSVPFIRRCPASTESRFNRHT